MSKQTNKDLWELYGDINDDFFDGMLPFPKKIRFGRPQTGSCAHTVFNSKSGFPVEIVIEKASANRMEIVSLIHEMIHVKFYVEGKRGKKYDCSPPDKGCWKNRPWAKEVRRLAKNGLFDWLV